MSYISLYRKYRPQTFEEVVGQIHITQTLANAVKQNRFSHAYLFAGPRGTGKTTTARIFAKALNCAKGPTPTPCNECGICLQIIEGNSIDVLEIDAASNRGIDEIRDLREKIRFTPTEARYKMYIIDEVHMLTTEAFNALLKTLEEPPERVVFVLATTEPHKVLPTILSRCQRFDFRRIPISNMVGYLHQIAKVEGIAIDETVLPLIARQAQGSLRDAIGFLEQLSSFAGEKIGLDEVVSLLGMVEIELLFEIVDMVSRKDTAGALFFVEGLMGGARDIRQFTKELIGHLRNLFVVRSTPPTGGAGMIDATPDVLARMEIQARSFRLPEIMRFMDILTEAHGEMRWGPDAKLLLEMALVKMTKPEADESLEGLLYRIDELERKIEERGSKDERRDLSASLRSPRPFEASTELSRMSKLKVPEPKSKGAESRGEVKKAEVKEVGKVHGVEEKREGEVIEKRKAEAVKAMAGGKGDEAAPSQQRPVAGMQAKGQGIDIARVKRAWPVILDQVKEKKIPTYALLLECKPCSVVEKTIVLEFNERASFHLQEMEKSRNLKVLLQSLKKVLGMDVDVECTLGEGEGSKSLETSLREEEPAGEAVEPHIVKLVQDSFGAEIIEEVEFTED
ncbi:MAG TPA: DNA polymerase III subunit gamma/tau [Actinobacteria bacterium]|nr:DNA polymerase III subunit gamma/tau [Actinomycetota bacterium]